jgi:ribosomal protein L27
MGGRVGGVSSIHYRETRGIKVAGGEWVKAGTILTRQGHRWKPGHNVIGRTLLTAGCDGEIYFTKRMGHYKRTVTFIHIKPKIKKNHK